VGAAPTLNRFPRLRAAVATAVALSAGAIFASSALAAPAPVGTQTATAASASSLTVAKPAGTIAGDVFVATVTVRFGAAATISTPTGWTLVRRDTCLLPWTQMTQAVYVRSAAALEPPSTRWTLGKAAGASAGIAAYRGVDGASPVAAHSGATARDSRTADAPSVTTSVPQTLLVGSFGRSGTSAVTTPAGTTRRYSLTGAGTAPAAIFALDQVRSAAGATGAISTQSTAVSGCTIGQLVALRPGAVAVDATAPSVPGYLRGTAGTTTSISVAWNASSDNVGVSGYGLYRDGASAGTASGTTSTFTGLACGRSYALAVDAADAAGNRSARATLTASTSACAPNPPPPPPSGNQVVLVDRAFVCNGPVNLDLVKVTMRNTDADAISLGSGCTGRIGRVEVQTWTLDGIKVQNQANPAHDLVIEGGYVKAWAMTPAAHQDGIQVMGGSRITFRNLSVDVVGAQNLFINKAGSGATTPTDIVCENCVLGPNVATPLLVNVSVRAGARNTLVCTATRYGRSTSFSSASLSYVNVANSVLPVGDPRCANITGV
jgi:hypothetical protein